MTVLPAHFDGERIRLDTPFKLEPNTNLLITVLPDQPADEERTAWLHLSRQALGNAYSDNEPEYTLDLIEEPNPEYAGR